MFKRFVLSVLLIVAALSAGSFSQYLPTTANPAVPKIFPLADLREGMKGTAKTVFRGSKSEEFGVEILGVVPNSIGPKQDMIVGRLSGANAERTFVFAGMSGSPVYIDGKLLGAISYSFPFAKEPICGITPFEQMQSVVDQSTPSRVASVPKTFSYAELAANTPQTALRPEARMPMASGFEMGSGLMAVAGQTFQPIATPLYFSGVSQKTLNIFAPELTQNGVMAVGATAGGSSTNAFKQPDETSLLGGDSVVVQLARGDIQLAAAGTVTQRDGDKIYAFGHPFFSLGSSNLPMSESHVVIVVPNANNSFKLAVGDSTVGSMTQDRATGIYGRLGQEPKLLPVKVTMRTSRGKDFEMNFESAFDELLTPLIVSAGIGNALAAQERSVGDTTIDVDGEITVKGEQSIRIARRFAGPQASIFAAGSATVPLALLLRANFDGLDITGVRLKMTAVDGSKTASVERITVDKTQVKAGETLEITAFERTESGNYVVQKTPFTVPKDTAPGTLSLMVGDGTAVQQNAAIAQFTPRTAAEMIAIFNKLKRPDRLYAILTRTSTGAIVGASEMPNLPPSVLATMNNDRTAGGTKTSVQTTVAETELPPGEFVVSGSQTLNIEVIR